jgi:hypothetical protein
LTSTPSGALSCSADSRSPKVVLPQEWLTKTENETSHGASRQTTQAVGCLHGKLCPRTATKSAKHPAPQEARRREGVCDVPLEVQLHASAELVHACSHKPKPSTHMDKRSLQLQVGYGLPPYTATTQRDGLERDSAQRAQRLPMTCTSCFRTAAPCQAKVDRIMMRVRWSTRPTTACIKRGFQTTTTTTTTTTTNNNNNNKQQTTNNKQRTHTHLAVGQAVEVGGSGCRNPHNIGMVDHKRGEHTKAMPPALYEETHELPDK